MNQCGIPRWDVLGCAMVFTDGFVAGGAMGASGTGVKSEPHLTLCRSGSASQKACSRARRRAAAASGTEESDLERLNGAKRDLRLSNSAL